MSKITFSADSSKVNLIKKASICLEVGLKAPDNAYLTLL